NSTIATLPYSGFTTKWYRHAFANQEMVDAMKLSAKIAILNAFLATGLGVVAAIGLSAKRLLGRSVITAILMLPLVVPYVVLGIGMLILLHQLGFGQSQWAILAAHMVITVPYS